MFTTYIAKASANIGFPTTRPIYEGALEVLANKQTARMCSHFAQDWPDRPIYAHASQLCDLRVLSGFWTERYSFEIDTGSEDTFREMLNIKRGVHAQSSSDGCGASMHDGSGGRRGRCGRPGGASKDMTLSLRRRLPYEKMVPMWMQRVHRHHSSSKTKDEIRISDDEDL